MMPRAECGRPMGGMMYPHPGMGMGMPFGAPFMPGMGMPNPFHPYMGPGHHPGGPGPYDFGGPNRGGGGRFRGGRNNRGGHSIMSRDEFQRAKVRA